MANSPRSAGGAAFVEADETFIGREPGKPKKSAYHHKMKALSLVDRTTGQARSVVVDDLKPATVVPILEENIGKEARVVTDEAGQYHYLRESFAEHSVVRHVQEEYVSLENPAVHTNTRRGFLRGALTRHVDARLGHLPPVPGLRAQPPDASRRLRLPSRGGGGS